jgi:hypothetical protein
MLRDDAWDSLLSARTGGVASFNLWSRQNVCCLARETSRDPKRSDGNTSVRTPRKKDAKPLSTARVGG